MCAGKVPRLHCSPPTHTHRAPAPARATVASSDIARARQHSQTRRAACHLTSTSLNSISCGARSTTRGQEVRDLSDGSREDRSGMRQLPAVLTCTMDCNGMQLHQVPVAALFKDFIKAKAFNSLILQVIAWTRSVCLVRLVQEHCSITGQFYWVTKCKILLLLLLML